MWKMRKKNSFDYPMKFIMKKKKSVSVKNEARSVLKEIEKYWGKTFHPNCKKQFKKQ